MSLVSDIPRLILESGQAQAAGNLAAARAIAHGQREQGKIWGSTLASIGQTVGNLPIQIAKAKEADQEQKIVALKLDESKRHAADMQALDEAFQTPGGREAIIQKLPGHLRPTAMKQFADLDELHAKSEKAAQDAETAQREAVAYAAVIVREHDYDPFAAQGAISDLKQKYANNPQMMQQLQQFEAAFRANPDKAFIKSVIDPIIKPSSFGKRDLEERSVAAAETRAAREAQPPQPTPASLAAQAAGGDPAKALELLNADKTADNTRQSDSAAETARHNRAMEGAAMVRARRPAAGGESSGGEAVTQDAIEETATQARLLGNSVIPTRLSENTKNRILNAKARQNKALGLTPAQAVTKQLMTKADATSLNKLGVLSASAEAFESKAIAQAGLIRDISEKVGRTKFPIINNAIQSGREHITGDEEATKLANAITTFSAEYAKIMEGSTGSVAGSSEGARKAATRLINTGMSKGTLDGVLDLMQQEMRLTIQGYDVAKEHVTSRVGSGQTQAPTLTPTMRYNPATGKVEPIR